MRSTLLILLLSGLLLQLHAQTCIRMVDTETFSSTQAFTAVGAGNVSIMAGEAWWNDAPCGAYDRWYRLLADTLSDNYFRVTFSFTVLPNAAGFGVGANLFAVTAGTLDFLSYDGSLNFDPVDQDGLGIVVYSTGIHDNNIDNWQLVLQEKEGLQRTIGNNVIFLSSQISNYFLVFERISPVLMNMMLYTDSTQTTLLGQAQNPISQGVDKLSVFQFGVTTFGWHTRHFNGYIDEFVFCDDSPVGIEEFPSQFQISISENFVDNTGFIVNSGYPDVITMMVLDITGGLVHKQEISNGENQIPSKWIQGLYLLKFIKNEKTIFAKKVVIK